MRKRNAASAAAGKISDRNDICIELVCLSLALALFFLAARISSML
jgi:hypothetical protein